MSAYRPRSSWSDILSRILDLVESREQETHRVLIVEDSKTAVAHIQRALDLHGIDSRAINTRWRCSRSVPNSGRTPS